MIRIALLAACSWVALTSSASANPLALVPILAGAIEAATAGAIYGAGATVLATIGIGAATIATSRGMLVMRHRP